MRAVLSTALTRLLSRAVRGGGRDVPAAPSGLEPIEITAYQNFGLTGTQRATGVVHFPPGMVTAADLDKASLWNGPEEVPLYIADRGARHKGTAYPDSLLYAEIELDAAFPTIASTPSFTLKWDQPVGAARLTRQGPSYQTNTLDLSLNAAGTHLQLNAAIPFHHPNEDFPRLTGTGQVAWDATFTTSTGGASSWGSETVIVICADQTGTLKAFPRGGYTSSGPRNAVFMDGSPNFPWYPGVSTPATRWQPIAVAFIHIPVGTSVTYGTTNIATTPGVSISTTAGTYKPLDVTLEGVPACTCSASDPDYLVRCYFPGYRLWTAAGTLVEGGTFATLQSEMEAESDVLWANCGQHGSTDSASGTSYNFTLMEWMLYAQTGKARYLRRALGYGRFLYDYWGTVSYTPGEPAADSESVMVYSMLVNDPSYHVAVSKVARQNEEGQLSQATGGGILRSRSGRKGLHAKMTFWWADRAGVELSAVVGGSTAYVLNPTYDHIEWPTGASWNTSSTNADRWKRLVSRSVTFMRDAGTQYPENVGQRGYILGAYDENTTRWGIGPFMQAHDFCAMILGAQTWGVQPGMLDMIRDGEEILWTGVSPITGEPFLRENPLSFEYQTPGAFGTDFPDGTLTNAMADANPTTVQITGDAFPSATPSAPRHFSVDDGTVVTVYRYTGNASNTLSGVQVVYGTPTVWAAGARARALSGPATPGYTADLNGFHILVHLWLLQQTLEPVWRTRGDGLYAAMVDNGFGGTNHKTLPEVGLHSQMWLPERVVSIPGVSGILGAVGLNTSSASLMTAPGLTATAQLTVDSHTDALGDAVSSAGASYAWESSDPAVATVDTNGLVTAVSAGTATITVTVTIGAASASASCSITVGTYTLYDGFDGSAVDAQWLAESSSGANSVTGGDLVQTASGTNGYAKLNTVVTRNLTGKTLVASLASCSSVTLMQPMVCIYDATTGAGVAIWVLSAACTARTVTDGSGSVNGHGAGTTAQVGSNVTLPAETPALFELKHVSGTTWSARVSLNGGSTWTALSTSINVASLDPANAKVRVQARCASGATVQTVRWSVIEAA